MMQINGPVTARFSLQDYLVESRPDRTGRGWSAFGKSGNRLSD